MKPISESLKLDVVPMSADRVDDFFKLHSVEQGCGWCYCVAWWTPTWQGWGERTAEENYKMRLELFERGHYDGYLAYAEGEPVAWCQVGRRERLKKLLDQFGLEEASDGPEIWSITCFLVAPQWRRQKVATTMLAAILGDLNGWMIPICGRALKRCIHSPDLKSCEMTTSVLSFEYVFFER